MSASIHFEQRRFKGAETENPYNYKYSLNWKKETDKRKNSTSDI